MTLHVTCHDCEDGFRYIPRLGGNDPDVRRVRCEYCDGEGEISLQCEASGCPRDATERLEGVAFCGACAAVERADAFWVVEDVA